MSDERYAVIVVWDYQTTVYDYQSHVSAKYDAARLATDPNVIAVFILNTKTLVMERVKATVTTEVVG